MPLLLIGLGIGLMAAITLAVALGPVTVPLAQTWRVIGHHLIPAAVDPPDDPLYDQFIWNFRLPRALLGAVIGAALALVGAALQAVVRNPLAEPYVLGVSAGAAFGAVLIAVLGASAATVSLSTGAFAGALLATGLLYLLAQRGGRITTHRFILAGVALAYLFQAAYSYLLLKINPFQTQGILFFLLGTLENADWDDLGLPAAVLVGGSILLLLRARALNALLAGEETAISLGLDVARFRIEMLVLTSLLVGIMVAISGAIAFVGLIVPHAVRLIVGTDHRRLLPTTALVGAIFLVLVDLAARIIDQPTELPLTIVTALFGVPFFLWLLRRRHPNQQPLSG